MFLYVLSEYRCKISRDSPPDNLLRDPVTFSYMKKNKIKRNRIVYLNLAFCLSRNLYCLLYSDPDINIAELASVWYSNSSRSVYERSKKYGI